MSATRPRAAVLGSPIGHSLSPVLHRAAYAEAGLDWDYTAIDCTEAGLPEMLQRVRNEPGWRGLSLTMPLKVAAVPLVDRVGYGVDLVGAVNTIVVIPQADGPAQLLGHNTDIAGIQKAILETGIGAIESGVVLGAGGTARAAVAALAALGAQVVIVVARDVTRTADLVAMGERLRIEVEGAPWSAVAAELAVAEIVVATTPAGATDALADPHVWPAGVPLVDVLYDPWPTKLAAYAALRGSPVVGGMSVLAHQASDQVSEMTGIDVPVQVMRAAGERALRERASTTGD